MSLVKGYHPCEVKIRGIEACSEMRLETVRSTNNDLYIEATLTMDRTAYPMLPPAAGVSRLAFVDISIVARPTQIP